MIPSVEERLQERIRTMTKGELAFLDQMTRKMTTEWADHLICGGVPLLEPKSASEELYRVFARQKGWISADWTKLNSAGWRTATSFLKR